MNLTLLGPKGLPMVDLSGDRAFSQHKKGNIVASMQWIDLRAQNPEYDEVGPVPCMALFHAHRHSETGAYVIPLRAAFKYIRSDGMGPTIFFHDAVAKAVLTMGFSPHDKSAISQTMDVVRDALPDLYRMPSEQPDALEIHRPKEGIQLSMSHRGKAFFTEEI